MLRKAQLQAVKLELMNLFATPFVLESFFRFLSNSQGPNTTLGSHVASFGKKTTINSPTS
jgi:hypothetical protein